MTRGLADFAGAWLLSRRIFAADGGVEGRFEGTAVLEADGHGLGYLEQGVLRIGGQPPLQATRRYQWREGIEVLFEDGRFFHRFDPGLLRCEARHDCAPDMYEVVYDFSLWPVWSQEWRVTGPRKAYRMISEFRRAGGG